MEAIEEQLRTLEDLLVYAPGGYKFADFVRVGAPLTVLVGVIVALLAPIMF